MKTMQSIFIAILALASIALTSDANADINTNKIRILLQSDTSEALLEVRGPYYILNPSDSSRIGSGLLGKRFIIRPTANGIRWGGEFPGVHQVTIVPRSPESAILVNGIQYDGNIIVYKIGNKINIINELSVESYLKSALSDAFSSNPLENEVMAAVAITARTTAYYTISKNPDSYWHLKKEDVAYSGNALIIPHSHVVRAVDSTHDLILVHQENGENLPFAACWNEHCAGKTAAYNSIFRKDVQAPKAGVEAPHAALDREESKWNISIDQKEFASSLNISSKIKSIEPFIDAASGKIYAIRINTEEGAKDFDFFAFQEKFGTNTILSNDFLIEIKNSAINLLGYGKGHGVGLCIYSASAMAQNGDMAVKILSKFFPNTFLLNLSATPLK